MELKTLASDRSLIDVNFDGYKLSGTAAEYGSADLMSGPRQVTCDTSAHFSYQYISAFGLHNHLSQDPWSNDCVYYFDAELVIHRVSAELHDATPEPVDDLGDKSRIVQLNNDRVYSMVHSMDAGGPNPADPMNASMMFASERLVVASDGCGTLYLLRKSECREPWVALLITREVMQGQSYAITAAIASDDESSVSCAVWRIVDDPDTKTCVSTINIITLALDMNGQYAVARSLEAARMRFVQTQRFVTPFLQTLQGPASPAYTCFNVHATELLIVAEKQFVPEEDQSALAVDKHGQSNGTTAHPQTSDGEPVHLGHQFPFAWVQTSDSVTISTKLPPGTRTSDIACFFYKDSVQVSLLGVEPLLPRGKLYAPILPNDCMWTRDGDVLDIHIEKAEGSGRWVYVFDGDSTPETVDPSELRKAVEALDKYTGEYQDAAREARGGAGLSNEMEEVDFDDEDRTKTLFIYAIASGATFAIVSKVAMGTQQWLFNSPRQQNSSPFLGVKYNVDCLLYSPQTHDGHLAMTHTATFNALAYVVASKRDKKYMVCSGDARFAAVSDCSRQVYVYKQPAVPGAHSAAQAIVSLNGSNTILGLQASKNFVFVLTEQQLHAAHIS